MFPPVVRAFGPLSEKGERQLAQHLVRAVMQYRLRLRLKKSRPAEEKKKLARIAKSAAALLKQLGVREPQELGRDSSKAGPYTWAGALLVPELYRVAKDRRPATAALDAHERWATLLLLLSDLQEAAKRCSMMVASIRGEQSRGRGGKTRQGPDAESELLNNFFQAYAKLRRAFPRSGRALACDKRLRNFVRAGHSLAMSSAPPFVIAGRSSSELFELVDKAIGPDLTKSSHTTDAAIRKAFERWWRQTKLELTNGLGVEARKPTT